MTDLEPRLDRLRDTPVPPGPDAAQLRTRAARRRTRRHRRTLLATVPVVVALVVGAAVLATGDDPSQSVVTGSDPTTTEAPATTATSTTATTASTTRSGGPIGTVGGLSVQVAPTTGLRDGQFVTVEIDGLDQLETPVIIQCTGSVDAGNAARECDLSALEPGGTSEGVTGPQASQQVAVRRVIRIPRMAGPDDDQGGHFDCATEPEGCALVVGNNTLPAKGFGVPLAFAPVERPDPAVTVDPATRLTDRQEVRVRATGLRPNTTYSITQCTTAADPVCDEMTWPEAKTDADGVLRSSYVAAAAIYGWKGRGDCVATECVIQVGSTHDDPGPAQAPVRFAAGTVAPEPHLEISPTGPYEDQQVVTVTGTGFPPGHQIAWEIGQCPNDKDTAVEERCGYDALGGEVFVDDDGRFTDQIRLYRSGACSQPAGCHLGWVINHGPTLAKVPLEFR